MGLDVVEIVLCCEEQFNIRLEDQKLESASTVGDLFELICQQLDLPYGPQEPRPVIRAVIPRATAPLESWTRDTAWSKVVQIY